MKSDSNLDGAKSVNAHMPRFSVQKVLERPNAQARVMSKAEEVANTISHGAGLLAAIVGVPYLVWRAVLESDAAGIVGVSVFGGSLVLVYLMSTLYHAWPRGRAKQVFRLLDHMAIFLLIAGTYTPFTLTALRGGWGWTLFGTVWGLAFAGVIFKAIFRTRYPAISVCLYLGMGWLAVAAIKPLWEALPAWGFFWLIAGGLSYTVGVAFYALERIRFFHLAWHIFVLAGSACHFFAVLRYAL